MIKHKKLRAISECTSDVVVSGVSVRDMARELITLRTLCDEVYLVVGYLTALSGLLTDEVERALDNLAAAGDGKNLPHKSLIPFRVNGDSK